MENPFIFGKAVDGKHFVDREKEIKELQSTLHSGQHIVLFSPRKMGKTSLIKETFRKTKDITCIYIDLWQTPSQYALAKEIINTVINNTYTSAEKLGHDLKDLFKSLRPKISLDMEGRISIEFSREETVEALKEALDFPERVARKKNIRLTVAFDEFQEIEHLNGLQMEKIFRSILQHHEHTSYIFAGSERSLITIIFAEKERPFYRFAKHMELKPIDNETLAQFVIDKFIQSGKKIDKNAVQQIIEFSKGIPHYVQHLSHEVWYMTTKEATIETINICLKERILPSLSSGFQAIWNRLKSDEQKRVLIGLANETTPQIYSQGFIKKYDLKTPSHVRKAVKSLEETELLEKNNIWDPFFKEWIKINFSI